jgi:hypothetical protein
MRINEISSWFRSDPTANKAKSYHKATIDAYFTQWKIGVENGKFGADAAGFDRFKKYVDDQMPPGGVEVSANSPLKFDDKSVMTWIDAAIKEKNSQARTKQETPAAAQQTPAAQQSAQQTPAAQQSTSATTQPKPSVPTPKQIQPGQEVEFPGTNYKFKYAPSWMDAAGKPASEAAAKILNQLAAGKTGADLDRNEIRDARRSMGLPESRKSKGTIL